MAGSSTCPHCGMPVPQSGTSGPAVVRFCGSCGGSMLPSAMPPAPAPVAASPQNAPAAHVPAAAPPSMQTQLAMVSPFAANAEANDRGSAGKRTMVEFAAPTPPVRAPVDAAKTLIGASAASFSYPPQTSTPAPPSHPEPHGPQGASGQMFAAAAHLDPHRTMLGMSFGPAESASLAPAATAVSAPPAAKRDFARTMLGVALPGIAPTGASNPPLRNPPTHAAQFPNGQLPNQANQAYASNARGAAPVPAGMAASTPLPRGAVEAFRKRRARDAHAPVVPAPKPLVDEPLPAAPRFTKRRGLPIAAVLGTAAALAVVLGVVLLSISHGTLALTAEPRTAGDGAEMLHLACAKCEDGTTATLEGKVATMAAGVADLALVSPLHPGKNDIELLIRRPGIARDETVKLEVPVSFRLAPDLSHLTSHPPTLGVRIDALAGSKATVGGAPVALDAAGHGAAAIDITKDVEGASDDMKRIERSVAYEVTPPAGAAEKGALQLRIGIAQLHLDSPNLTPVTASPDILVAGVVAPGAQVAVNDAPVTVAADGRFAQKVLLVLGATPIVVAVSQGTTVASRMVHITAVRVPDLEAEAKARDAAVSPRELDFESVSGDIDSHAGQDIAIAGALVEARQVGHQMLMLVDDRRGCATPDAQCLVRVIYGGDGAPTSGRIRAYGKVTRSFRTVSGRIVPEIAADFLLPGGKGP